LPIHASDAKNEKSSPKKNEAALLLADTAQANRTFDHRDMQRNTLSPVSSPSKRPAHSAEASPALLDVLPSTHELQGSSADVAVSSPSKPQDHSADASPSKNAPLAVVPSTHELQGSSADVAVSSPSKPQVHSADASPSKNAPLAVVPSTHELQGSSADVAVSSPSKPPYMWPAGTNVLVCTMHKPKASPQFLHVGTVHAVVWNPRHELFAYNIQKENSSVITKMIMRDFVFKLEYPNPGDVTRLVGKSGRRDAVTLQTDEGRGDLHRVALDYEMNRQYGSLHMDKDIMSPSPSYAWFAYKHLWPEDVVANDRQLQRNLGMNDLFNGNPFTEPVLQNVIFGL
jgi:hypothetical protein